MVYTYYDYLENYYDEVYNGSYDSTYHPPSAWKQPFPMDIFNPIFWGLQILCAILSFCLLSMVIFRIYSNRKQEKKSLGTFLPLFTLTMHSVLIIFSPFNYYTWYIQYNPDSTINMWLDEIWDLIW